MKIGNIFFTSNLNDRFKTFHKLAIGSVLERPAFGIRGIRIANGGSGFTSNTKFDIIDPSGSGAIVTPVIENGVITGGTVVSKGEGYVAPICRISDTAGSGADVIPLLDGHNGLFRFNSTSNRYEAMLDYEWINYLTNRDIKPDDWESGDGENVTREILSEIMKRLTFTSTGSISLGMNIPPSGTIARWGNRYGEPIEYPSDWSVTNQKYKVPYISEMNSNLEVGLLDDITNRACGVVSGVPVINHNPVVFTTDLIIDFAYFIDAQDNLTKRRSYKYDGYCCLGEIIDSTPNRITEFFYDTNLVPITTDVDSPDYGKFKMFITVRSHGNYTTDTQQQDFQFTVRWFVSITKFRDFNVL